MKVFHVLCVHMHIMAGKSRAPGAPAFLQTDDMLFTYLKLGEWKCKSLGKYMHNSEMHIKTIYT